MASPGLTSVLIILSVLINKRNEYQFVANRPRRVIPPEACLRLMQRQYERYSDGDVDASGEGDSTNRHVLYHRRVRLIELTLAKNCDGKTSLKCSIFCECLAT